MGEEEARVEKLYEMLNEIIKNKVVVKRLCGIIKLQLEVENEESNIVD